MKRLTGQQDQSFGSTKSYFPTNVGALEIDDIVFFDRKESDPSGRLLLAAREEGLDGLPEETSE